MSYNFIFQRRSRRNTYELIELSLFLACSISSPLISRSVPVTATPPVRFAPAISFMNPRAPTSCFQYEMSKMRRQSAKQPSSTSNLQERKDFSKTHTSP